MSKFDYQEKRTVRNIPIVVTAEDGTRWVIGEVTISEFGSVKGHLNNRDIRRKLLNEEGTLMWSPVPKKGGE